MTTKKPTREQLIMANRGWLAPVFGGGFTPTMAANELELCTDSELQQIAALQAEPARNRRQLLKVILTARDTRLQAQ